MPFYADLSSLYGTPSSSYSAPYLSGPYSSHSSIIASNFTRPTASFGKPTVRGFTSSRNYKPHLATITESQLTSRPIPRINPPSLLLHTSPKFKIQRPISINTADIDVSVNKYRKFERTSNKPVVPLLKFDRKQAERDMVKPTIEPAAPPEETNDPFMPRIDSDTRSTIKRQRTVVRIHTDHNAPGNKVAERSVTVLKPKWRENFDPSELSRSEKKMPVKTPGAKLVEKFLIKETIKEEDEDRIRNENEERKRMREEKLKMYDDGKKHRRSVKRKQSIKKSPSFHDICKTISSDKINEDLNPVHTIMEQRRQSKIYCEDEILKQIRRNSAEILQEQVLMLDEILRQQTEVDATANKAEDAAKKAHGDELETDEDKISSEFASRGSIKRKKKITKKKSNEKITLPPDDEEEVKSSLHRRPVHKKTRRSSTASSLDSVLEDSPYDKDTEQAYQDAIRDISQGDVEKIEVKTKSNSNDMELKLNLKAVVEEIQVEEAPKTRRKLAINYSVEETGEQLKNIKKASDKAAKVKLENADSSVLKRNLQNMLLETDLTTSLKTLKVENTGVIQNAKAQDVMTSSVLQKQPILGASGKVLQEKIVPTKKNNFPIEKASADNVITNFIEVNNNDLTLLSDVQVNNKLVVNKASSYAETLKQTSDAKITKKQNDLVNVKNVDSKLSGQPETLDSLAKENVDKVPNLLSKSKSVKELDIQKLNEFEKDEIQSHCLNEVHSRADETKQDFSKDLDKSKTDFVEAADVKDVINQAKPLGADKTKIPGNKLFAESKQDISEAKSAVKVESKAQDKQILKQRKFASKATKADAANEDGEVDFWSSIDPEENMNKTRELLKAEQEKWQTIKWEQETQRLEEIEKAKLEQELQKQKRVDEELKKKQAEKEAQKLKQAQEEEKRKRRLKEEEELKRRRAELEEQKRKLAEEAEKRKLKLAEEEAKRKQKLEEEEKKKKEKLAEEEENKKRKLEEEERRKQKLVEEEQKRKQKLEEEEAKRKLKLQEEEKRKQKQAEEEEKKKRKQEEEERRKQKLAEEEERRKQMLAEEEEKRKQKLAEEEKKKTLTQQEEEKRKQKLAEEAQKRKQKTLDEEKRKQKLAEEEERRKQKQKEEEEKKLKEKLLHEEKVKRKRLKDELQKQKLLEDARKRKQQEEEEETNRKQKALEEEEQFRKDAEVEAERIRIEDHKRMVSKRSIVTKFNTVQDPDLDVFQVPEEPEQPEEEPNPEQSSGGFVPLQSNRLSQFMIPFQKPEHFDECPIVIMATPKDIRKRHYPRPRVSKKPTPSPPPPLPPKEEEDQEDSEEDSDESEDSSEDGSDTSSASCSEEEYTVERSGADIGKSTSSTDSGFDSSAPGSPANRRHNG